MSNEIHETHTWGNQVYAVIRNRAGQVWWPTGQVFENWGTSGRAAADYAISLAQTGGSLFVGDFDTNISTGRYTVQTFYQGGGSPADGDPWIGQRIVFWTGTAILTADKVLINKAVQNKSTGTIQHYDDDGATLMLTLTPTDGESSITRDRS